MYKITDINCLFQTDTPIDEEKKPTYYHYIGTAINKLTLYSIA